MLTHRFVTQRLRNVGIDVGEPHAHTTDTIPIVSDHVKLRYI
jgi:hypothetical protein